MSSKTLLLFSLALLTTVSSCHQGSLNSNLTAFVQGFLNGTRFPIDIVDKIQDCIPSDNTISDGLQSAFDDIFTTVSDTVEQGIALLGQTAQYVPKAVESCNVTDVDVETIYNLTNSFINPVSFRYHRMQGFVVLTVNETQIYEDIFYGYIMWSNHQDWKQLGESIGSSMHDVYFGWSPEDENEDNSLLVDVNERKIHEEKALSQFLENL